ncbi:ribbon-helix-helix domain-containing protein [Staphylococcus caprae]|uniref:ribbon-helix-helix domain-containing protein n=1 Tax=Staphylococcus caprae TaxID=29380 RepID=UPI0014527CBA|nr:ribbon-helix-helix domain-containing protein [Staphylococcus caprae]QJE26664.1 ribbon-helix-helix domain-containing protein [Staphylococcus caprae]
MAKQTDQRKVVKIGTEQHKKLKQVNDETKVPMFHLINEAIEQYFGKYSENSK